MTALLLIVPALVVFLLFQVAKKYLPWLDNLSGTAKQILIMIGCIAAALLYAKIGLPVPLELQSLQSAAVVGLIQGLAAIGVHGVKAAATS